MARTILVPYDGSTTSARALPYAAAISKIGEPGRIVLLTVLPTREETDSPNGPMARKDWERTTRRRLQNAARRLRGMGVGTVDVETRWSVQTDEEIVGAAKERNVSLIVLGTHGRSGLSRALLGSTAMSVVRDSHVPCMLIPPGRPLRDLKLTRALLPIDGSELSAQALPLAIELANAGVQIEVLRVVPPSATMVPFAVPGAEGYLPVNLIEDLTAAAEEDVRSTIAKLPKGRASGTTLLGSPSLAIIEQAANKKVDVIVMTTHARSGLGRAFLGSVADRVVRTAKIPVIVIRPRG
ncbi:MAG: universal stress protein [Dehalococcoidia bacterium]|nr:universal stress protein [Dehalococcoidia bacterium]